MGKTERLQMRLPQDLKKWFKRWARARGGMSQVVEDQIRKWREEYEGTTDGPRPEPTGD